MGAGESVEESSKTGIPHFVLVVSTQCRARGGERDAENKVSES